MTDPIQDIIDAAALPDFGLQNPFLELASLTLEAKHAGLAYDRLKPTWERMRDERRARRGIFLRKPNDYSITTSKDEAFGIFILSALFDGGETGKEILDEGLIFGLWLTGKNEHGYWLDTEYFTFWRPDYLAFCKLMVGRRINWLMELFMRINISVSNTHNIKRVKLLALHHIAGYDYSFIYAELKKLGDRYRVRYGQNQLYWNLWEIQHD